MCQPRCWKSLEILHHYWVTKDDIVKWLSLLPNMEWIPHPLPTYERYLTTFIYSVDGHMEPSSCDYHYMCSPRCGKSNEILHHSRATKDTIVQWLRLLPKMEGIPHALPAYERCLKTFICCGWVHGSIIMPLSPHVLTQIWEVSCNLYHCWASATQNSIVSWLRL